MLNLGVEALPYFCLFYFIFYRFSNNSLQAILSILQLDNKTEPVFIKLLTAENSLKSQIRNKKVLFASLILKKYNLFLCVQVGVKMSLLSVW